MSRKISNLAVCVFAILVLGTIKATGSDVAKGPHRASDYFARTRETTLSALVGHFIVVGCEPNSEQTYRGSVVVARRGNNLHVQELIDGKTRTGTGTIEFEPESPTLEVVFEQSGVRAGFETWPPGERAQPRASGWVNLAAGDYHGRQKLGMEVWYDDQKPPDLASVQMQINRVLKDQKDPELLPIAVGDYRVIGEDTGTGRVYTGKVRAQSAGNHLKIDGSIDGKVVRGEMVRFANWKPTLIKYRAGAQSMLSFAGGYGVGDNYPRICGYFYPTSDSGRVIPNASPRLETWFFDWKDTD